MYDINIVIVNWKMKDDIDLCLKTLFEDALESKLNIIVHIIDNSSNSDGVKQMLDLKYKQVKYHDFGKNIGFGKAQNLGFKMAKAKFYLPLNPDITFYPKKQALRKMVDFLNNNSEIGMVGPKLLNIDDTIQNSCFRFPSFLSQIIRRFNLDNKYLYFKKPVDYYLMRDFNHNKTVPVDWIMGSLMLVKSEITDKVGFFDDRYFMYFEDCDWCRRIWQAGFKVYYMHDIIIKHGHRRESANRSPILAILKNPVTRIHIKSWLKYFWKWGIKKEHYGY